MTLYSDDPALEIPRAKQPRVIILPGDRQDIFTTSGLQKAAKVYESGEEPEGKLTTDRSRRLLESAGGRGNLCMALPVHIAHHAL